MCVKVVLQKYAETFKGMKRQGSELKRRKLINPHPKSANIIEIW